MIGYCENSKAYKVFDPNTKRVHISRNIQFFESKSWDWLGDGDSAMQNFVPTTDVEKWKDGDFLNRSQLNTLDQ